ncbi:MAG: YihY/virulence factor BrkB family protein [Flavisolibacter sp.]
MKVIKKFFSLLYDTFNAFLDDNCLKLSASLSYYTIFALAPLLLIVISLAGLFFGREAASGEIYDQLNGLIGSDSALQIQEIIANIQARQATTAGAIVGGLILFVGASGVFTEIQGSINYIWSVKAKPKKSWRKFLINRLLSFSLVLGLGFLLLVSLIISTVTSLLSHKLVERFPNSTVYFIHLVNGAVVFIVITSLFMVIFKVLPDARISWRDALVGAVFTALLFLGGKYLIGLYLQKANLDVTYGTAASIIIILTWVYYSSLILYFGAEFTKMFALYSGHGISPKNTAVFLLKSEAKEIPQSRLDT